jgi:hypothetical protein
MSTDSKNREEVKVRAREYLRVIEMSGTRTAKCPTPGCGIICPKNAEVYPQEGIFTCPECPYAFCVFCGDNRVNMRDQENPKAVDEHVEDCKLNV